ncbi:hypothetical protein CEXT_365581, partial [Caerostris extrusa]
TPGHFRNSQTFQSGALTPPKHLGSAPWVNNGFSGTRRDVG